MRKYIINFLTLTFCFCLFLAFTLSLTPTDAFSDPSLPLEGCSTMYYKDADCDGYGIGGKTTMPGFPTHQTLQHMGADADDNDASLNTRASVEAHFGSFDDVNNIKDFLAHKGFTQQFGDIYFVSTTGDNSTAEPNNINKPYFWTNPRGLWSVNQGESVVKKRDIIMYIGGTYSGGYALETMGVQGYQTSTGLQGAEGEEILITPVPGDTVRFMAPGGAVKLNKETHHVIIEGFELDGNYAPGLYSRQVIGLDSVNMDNIIFQNNSIERGDRWGIFSYIGGFRDNITFHNNVIAKIYQEHGIYHNSQDFQGSFVPPDDHNWIISNNLIYFCHFNGAQIRGGVDFKLFNNIIHSVGGNAIQLQNGNKNAVVSNNLLIDNARAGVVIFDDNDQPGHPVTDGVKVVNNTIYTKSGFPAIDIDHWYTGTATFRNLEFYNNILSSQSGPSFRFQCGACENSAISVDDVVDAKIKNNLFWRRPNWQGSESVASISNGSSPQGATSHNSTTYHFDLEDFQNPIYRPLVEKNDYGDPLFADVSNSYEGTPELFDFRLTEYSPAIDYLALQSEAPEFDITGAARVGLPEAGVYEFGVSYAPLLTNMSPTSIMTSPNSQFITLTGQNLGSINEFVQVLATLYGQEYVLHQSFIHSVSPNQIVLVTPPNIPAAPYENIRVRTYAGTTTQSFTLIVQPNNPP
ncbi:MAG: hypothetical protein ACI9F2_001115, partial [Lysobacterales bacterium]